MYIKRVKDLRVDHDYTQKFIASYLNLKQNSYSQLELGIACLSIEYLIKLSKLYNVSTDYILGLTDIPRYY